MAIGTRDENRPIRALLIGQTGSGKSSTGNTILSYNSDVLQQYFNVAGSTDAGNTRYGEKFAVNLLARPFEIIDTPGLQNVKDGETKIRKEITAIVEQAEHIDVFLYVVRIFQYGLEMNEDELKNLRIITGIFGEKVWKHTIFIFTHGNNYHNLVQFNQNRNPNVVHPDISFAQFLSKNAFTSNKFAIGPYVKKVDYRAVLFENLDPEPRKRQAMIEDLGIKMLALVYQNHPERYHASDLSQRSNWILYGDWILYGIGGFLVVLGGLVIYSRK